MNFLDQVIALLYEPPGSVIYHTGLLFAIEAALAIGLTYRRLPGARRIIWASGGMLVGRLALALVALLAWRGFVGNPDQILPPLERAVDALGAWLLIWALLPLFEMRPQWSDLLAGAISLLLAALYVFFATSWGAEMRAGAQSYVGSQQEIIWEVIQLVLLGTACVYSLVDRHQDWGLRFFLLFVLFIAHLIHFGQVQLGGSVAGWVRLGQLAAFPLFAVIAFRNLLGGLPAAPPAAEAPPPLGGAQQVKSLCSITASLDESGVAQAAIQALAAIPHAGALALFLAPAGRREPEQVTELELAALSNHGAQVHAFQLKLALDDAPAVRRAIKHHQPLLLRPGDADDPSRLALLMQIAPDVGLPERLAANLLVWPLPQQAQTPGVLLVQPAGPQLDWPGQERHLFEVVTAQLTVGLAHARTVRRLQDRLSRLQAHLNDPARQETALRAQLVESRQVEQELLAQIETARKDALQSQRQTQERAAEVTHQQIRLRALQEQVNELAAELREARGQAATDASAASPPFNQEHVDELVQELRQPVTSISGYTDLLLGGSIGGLGELQERLLQRIKASVARAGILLDDLVRTITARQDRLMVQVRPVKVVELVNKAVTEFAAELAEKGIDLQVSLDDPLPVVEVDPANLDQILYQLLANAVRSSPPEGRVRLEVRYQADETSPQENGREKGYLFISVADSGGGISPADQPHVFDRLYRVEHPDMAGVGDLGVGLPLVHELVQAHFGRIWVESVPQASSIFSLVLPTHVAEDV